MKANIKKLLRNNRRWRLLLTLELAVMLPAAALIVVNFHHVKSIQRDKNVEAVIHQEFQYMLAVSEKKINDRLFTMAEEAKDLFPSAREDSEPERTKRLDMILAQKPWLAHLFIHDAEKGFVFRSQPGQMSDPYFREEHERNETMLRGWFMHERADKSILEGMRKKNRQVQSVGEFTKRADGYGYLVHVFFPLPQISATRVVFGGVSFDPNYLKKTFFPQQLEDIIAQKKVEDPDNKVAMMVYPSEDERIDKPFAFTAGWGEGRPEVARNLNAFSNLSLGIKFEGDTAQAIAGRFVQQSFLILGVISLLMVGGLVLTYRSVSKELALARLKSDFVSNVSHELRTPLSLIQLYAETLELGRIKTEDKKEEYYRIIRKESERLGRLINNILDFSRIEAGRKEYDLRETDIAELVRTTLDAYRYQIERSGFEFEVSIDSNIPAIRVDREAIARAVVNLVNNALKYSADEKFLQVRLYRANGVVKLEVVDRGIGIEHREQTKIFEKFYRTGDPLVHNTKGSGLGLSLVKHITHAHGGQVEVESTPGKGSKFTLSLPLSPDAGQPASGAASGATA